MDYTQILLRPLISEKATAAKEATNSVAFFVHPSANKIEVKKAVEQAFNVKVEAVNIVKKASLARSRFGRATGRISGYKKAYVKLAAGDKIEFFEGV
ncbi:50S ribosomal protein L23 [Desulfovibrio aminophilus]|nr:50S ribosomal protein L23 [Desulfovibrio aminophilus]MCM0753730.1 50S ribosomal protein L23 [Desulfovibrio aminophilus]